MFKVISGSSHFLGLELNKLAEENAVHVIHFIAAHPNNQGIEYTCVLHLSPIQTAEESEEEA